MNDYKELIGDISDCLIAQPSEAVCKRVLREAADAIEQLVKERDEWKTLGSLANKRAEDYREMRRQRDKAIKERDAVVAEIPKNCNTCGRFFWDKDCVECKWEWRGVQEAEHEAD